MNEYDSIQTGKDFFFDNIYRIRDGASLVFSGKVFMYPISLIIAFFWIAAIFGDAFSTWYAITYLEAYEANPLANYFFEKIGIVPTLILGSISLLPVMFYSLIKPNESLLWVIMGSCYIALAIKLFAAFNNTFYIFTGMAPIDQVFN